MASYQYELYNDPHHDLAVTAQRTRGEWIATPYIQVRFAVFRKRKASEGSAGFGRVLTQMFQKQEVDDGAG